MTLKGRIQEDMKVAMKAGDKDRLKVVRLVLAAIKQVEVDERRELDDAAVLSVLDKMVKQRRDSVSQFRDGGRDDLADAEAAEIAILENYLPEQLSDGEIEQLVADAIAQSGAAGIRDMGRVMGIIKGQAAGRADMGAISALVRTKLSAA